LPPVEPAVTAVTVAPTVALVGPTAAGKSELAVAVADACVLGDRRVPSLGVELVSVDSMAVYRGMDIGTAKPAAVVRARHRVHLVDLVDPSEEFTVREYQLLAEDAFAGIRERGATALLVGGTGLYLRSITDDLRFPGRFPEVAVALEGEVDSAGPPGSSGERAVVASLHQRLAALDPVGATRVAPTNRRRLVRALEVSIGSGRPFSSFGPGLERYPPTPVVQLGLDREPVDLDERIAVRFDRLMDEGLLEEVDRLARAPGGLSRTARQALGYRELLSHLEDGVPLRAAVDEAVRRTRAFARRQRSWFRRDPRIVWMDPDEDLVRVVSARLGAAPIAAGLGD
jgi:tRNA dimethylallyltransferase